MSTVKKPVIFCDFDGTITNSDNIVAIMKHFHPAGCEPIMHQIVNGQTSIREGVGAMFALMPSEQKDEIISYVLGQAGIREGFARFWTMYESSRLNFSSPAAVLIFLLIHC